jgi:VWFA-related protein
MRLILCLLLSLAPLSRAVGAQESSPNAPTAAAPKISVDVQLVTVFATVQNHKGEIVNNLTKEDFVLDQDGHPQNIQFFKQESDLPLTLGLLVDTSLSQRSVLGQERTASYSFLDHLLREDKDTAFLIHFDREVELLRDLTSSRKKLEASLELLQESGDDDRSSGGGQRGHGSRGGGTLLYDAVYLASNEVMKKQQGRKAVIVLSDGVDRGSKETLEDAVEAAQRADTLVYSILFKGEESGGYGGHGHYGGMGCGGMGGGGMGPYGGGGPGGGGHRSHEEERPDGKKVLERMSQETGGHLFEVSKKQSIDQIYARIEQELRSQYSLGYYPEGVDAAAGYHKITLTTPRQKDMVIQAREGYYATR